jgi:hypothetical protein
MIVEVILVSDSWVANALLSSDVELYADQVFTAAPSLSSKPTPHLPSRTGISMLSMARIANHRHQCSYAEITCGDLPHRIVGSAAVRQ